MVFALSWPIASIGIAGFACLAVVLWALFRGSPGGAVTAAAVTKLAEEVSEAHSGLSRDLDGLRGEITELRSQVGEVLRVLREVD